MIVYTAVKFKPSLFFILRMLYVYNHPCFYSISFILILFFLFLRVVCWTSYLNKVFDIRVSSLLNVCFDRYLGQLTAIKILSH